MATNKIEQQILSLRNLLEPELEGARETTKILNGIIDDLKLGKLYAISCLRALSFCVKNKKLQDKINSVIEEIYDQS